VHQCRQQAGQGGCRLLHARHLLLQRHKQRALAAEPTVRRKVLQQRVAGWMSEQLWCKRGGLDGRRGSCCCRERPATRGPAQQVGMPLPVERHSTL
jgi:hypothetical protein